MIEAAIGEFCSSVIFTYYWKVITRVGHISTFNAVMIAFRLSFCHAIKYNVVTYPAVNAFQICWREITKITFEFLQVYGRVYLVCYLPYTLQVQSKYRFLDHLSIVLPLWGRLCSSYHSSQRLTASDVISSVMLPVFRPTNSYSFVM